MKTVKILLLLALLMSGLGQYSDSPQSSGGALQVFYTLAAIVGGVILVNYLVKHLRKKRK